MALAHQWLALSIGLAFLIAEPAMGEVLSYDNGRDDLPTYVSIAGTIGKDDVRKLRALIAHTGQKPIPIDLVVSLDSDGGDMEAAMEIGRLIRTKRAWTMVAGDRGRDSACASACVLILCAGSHRVSGGRVGIHRPFSSAVGAAPYGEASAEYTVAATPGPVIFGRRSECPPTCMKQ